MKKIVLALLLLLPSSAFAQIISFPAPQKFPPDCQDTGGNHVNFTLSTITFTCGTSGGSGSGGNSVTNLTPVTKNANSTGEQFLMEDSLGAGYLNSLGQPFVVYGAGVYSAGTALTGTIRMRAKLCTVSGCGSGTVVTLADITTTAQNATASNNGWWFMLKATTATAGASGNLEVHGILSIDLGASNVVADSVFTDTNTAVSSNIDLTAALFVDWSVLFSTNGATPNSMTQRQGEISPFAATAGGISASGTTGQVAFFAASGSAVSGENVVTLAQGGANTSLAATGGTSQFLRQATVGANITVVRPQCSDLSDASGKLCNVTAPSGTVLGTTDTQTLTNKRITKRVVTAADATSITPNTDNADMTYQANTQAGGTLTINADGGTCTNGQSWILKIKSTNVQTFSFNAVYVGGTTTLPTVTTGGGKIDYFGWICDTVNSKWDFVPGPLGF